MGGDPRPQMVTLAEDEHGQLERIRVSAREVPAGVPEGEVTPVEAAPLEQPPRLVGVEVTPVEAALLEQLQEATELLKETTFKLEATRGALRTTLTVMADTVETSDRAFRAFDRGSCAELICSGRLGSVGVEVVHGLRVLQGRIDLCRDAVAAGAKS